MKFLEIHIYSIMPSEPLPRVGAALGSGYTDSTASLGKGAHSLGWGEEAEMDQLVLAVRMSTEDALHLPAGEGRESGKAS